MIQSFQEYTSLENQFLIFFFEKSDFFLFARTTHLMKKTTYHTITFEPCSQKL